MVNRSEDHGNAYIEIPLSKVGEKHIGRRAEIRFYSGKGRSTITGEITAASTDFDHIELDGKVYEKKDVEEIAIIEELPNSGSGKIV